MADLALLFKPVKIHDWPDAYHVFNGDKRIGIVNKKVVRAVINGKFTERAIWFAHNVHFFSIKGEYATRGDAAAAIPKGAIHQPIAAFS